jgi:hypothetical protein
MLSESMIRTRGLGFLASAFLLRLLPPDARRLGAAPPC